MTTSTEISPSSLNLPFVEDLYAAFLKDPATVTPSWRAYFEQLAGGDPSAMLAKQGPSFLPASLFNPPVRVVGNDGGNGHGKSNGNGNGNGNHGTGTATLAPGVASLTAQQMQDRVDQLIRAYRVLGHMIAQIDPLGLPRPAHQELSHEYYGFTEADLDRPFSTGTIEGAGVRTLRRIIQRMRNTYCRSIGVQFMHIDDLAVRHWLQDRMEGSENRLVLNRDEELRTLELLTNAVNFEEFIQKKFQGAKRFSLEGAETLIPTLDRAIERGGEQGIQEVVVAMAHRGRLNVLANIMGKHPQAIFREFEDSDPELHRGGGDVKYHLGYSQNWVTRGGKEVHLSLCFNPSHLEFVDPVALGRCRAKQDRRNDYERTTAMTILIHGDAAFAGQGVIQEVFNLSQLRGYTTGGTLHVVVNNQIGFTTDPHEGRSCKYATDVAKMLQIPIFHVNGEDPEAVAQVVKLAMDFRHQWHRDVVIDLYCYRRHGHNEGDEPWFTQPTMYRAIEKRKSVRESYLDRLLELGDVTRSEADAIAERSRDQLTDALSEARSEHYLTPRERPSRWWTNYYGGLEKDAIDVDTCVPTLQLVDLLEKTTQVPSDFSPHPKIERMLKIRQEMAAAKTPLDWATAEMLAIASLSMGGNRVRLSGQDCERGTFSHRHSVLHDVKDGKLYCPLKNLSPEQAPIEIVNSPLSEVAVMGFEYGYCLDWPDGLVMWEAQFGDFCNVAQVIIDQFLVSAEDKWRRFNGLVLLLPHGFEGMGPEHSSARLERFLMLAAEDNIQIINATTPAQYFHALRRQVLRRWRKPMVIMTPKKLLRYPRAVSQLSDLSSGGFQRIIPDTLPPRDGVTRVLMCAGKVYYDLEEERERLNRQDVAILRLEQLYPLQEEHLAAALAPYADGTPVYWVQEEPENMGAWRYLRVRFLEKMLGRYPFHGIARHVSASPATGSKRSHDVEQAELLTQAFAQ